MAPGYFLLFIIHPLKLCIMTTTNRLFYTVSKRYIQAGTTLKSMLKYYWLMIAKIIYAIGV